MIKEKLIKSGIKNLKEFGYPHVNENNIFTDAVYSAFFKSMLRSEIGIKNEWDEVINELLQQIDGK